MTGDAVGIAMTIILPMNCRKSQLVLVIIEVHLIDPRHGGNDIQGALEHCIVILQHGIVERSFNDRTDMVSALTDGPIEEIHID